MNGKPSGKVHTRVGGGGHNKPHPTGGENINQIFWKQAYPDYFEKELLCLICYKHD